MSTTVTTTPSNTKFFIMRIDHNLGWQGCSGVFDTLDGALQGLDDCVHEQMKRGFEWAIKNNLRLTLRWSTELKIDDGVVFVHHPNIDPNPEFRPFKFIVESAATICSSARGIDMDGYGSLNFIDEEQEDLFLSDYDKRMAKGFHKPPHASHTHHCIT